MAARFSYFRGRAGGRNQRCPEAGEAVRTGSLVPYYAAAAPPPERRAMVEPAGGTPRMLVGGGRVGNGDFRLPGARRWQQAEGRTGPGGLFSAPAVPWVVLTAALEGKEGAKGRG